MTYVTEHPHSSAPFRFHQLFQFLNLVEHPLCPYENLAPDLHTARVSQLGAHINKLTEPGRCVDVELQ